MKRRYVFSIAVLAMFGSYHLSAVGAEDKRVATPAVAQMSEGEVKKVNKELGKITIKHGPITNLKMPPMTMVFQVKDKAMLDQIKEGDAINFVAEKDGYQYMVTTIVPIAPKP
jgi:Cu(I)/Ag(I) efflux system periplasmic protein CusF